MNDPNSQAYDEFTASLDPALRDAVTKLMMKTRTRPDDPQMVGVCLTIAEAQARVLTAQEAALGKLQAMKTDPELKRGIQRTDGAIQSLKFIEETLRMSYACTGVFADLLALVWVMTLVLAWQTAYGWARNDLKNTVDQRVCAELDASMASVARYWRSLHMTAAADRLGRTEIPMCRR